MKLIFPLAGIDHFATDKLIRDSVDQMNDTIGSYLILEKDELTYAQALSTENGIIVQFQEGSINSHFEFDVYMSRPRAINLLLAYADEDKDWKMGFLYRKVNVQGFWGALGYKLGHLYGSLSKFFSSR